MGKGVTIAAFAMLALALTVGQCAQEPATASVTQHFEPPPVSAPEARTIRDQFALRDYDVIAQEGVNANIFSDAEAGAINDLGTLANNELVDAAIAEQTGDKVAAQGHNDTAEQAEDMILAWLKLGEARAAGVKG